MAELDARVADVLYELTLRLAENGDAVLSALDKLVALERSGILDQLVKLSELLPGLGNVLEAIDESSVEAAARNLELILTLALAVDEKTIKTLEAAIEAFRETEEYEPLGMFGLLKKMREPEVQKAVGYLLAILANFGRKLP